MKVCKCVWRGRSQREKWTTSVVSASLLLGTLGILLGMPSVKAQPYSDVWVDDDYVGLPAPYYETITEGIANVEVGGTVHVNPGDYDESLSIDKDLDIVENGSGERVLSRTLPGDSVVYVTISNSAEVGISGLTIREERTKPATGFVIKENSHVNVTNCSFLDLNAGIIIDDGSSAQIEHNLFNQTVYIGSLYAKFVYVTSQGKAEDTTVTNNTVIFKNRALGVLVYKSPILLIENNIFYQNYSASDCANVGDDMQYSAAVALYQHGDLGSTTVRNNTMSGFCWGISTEGANATVENNTLADCHICISSFGYDAYTSNLTVANNTITFYQYGLQVMHYWSYINASNNSISSNIKGSGVGILVGIGQTNGRLDLGPNNTISNSSLGVKTYYKTFTNATGNTIFGTQEAFHSEGTDNINNNTIYSNDEGIRVQGSPSYGNRVISNNSITNSSVRAGIWIRTSTNGDLIQNNEITGGYRGIWITEGSSFKTIRWNNISNNVYGIQLEPGGSVSPGSNEIRRNNISINEYGIHAYSSNGNFLEYNNISGNRNAGIYLDTVNSVTLRYSNITNNFIGIMLTEEQLPPFSSIIITRNSILGSTLWAINSSMSDLLDVTENFFGAWSNDTIEEMLSGNLLYYPWLGYRESNVVIIEMPAVVFPGIAYIIDKGIIVNSSGSLSFLNDVDVVFNNSLGQNFIQVNGQMTVDQGCTFSSNFGNFTVLYLNGSSGIISQSSFEGQLGLSIQSSGMAISDSSFTNGTNGVMINQGDNNSISGSKMSVNRDNGTYLFSSSWNEYTSSEISLNGDFGVRVDMSDNNSIIGGDVETNGLACVSLWHSTNNNISLLNVTSCLHGIYSEFSTSNSFTSNNISSNDYGIQLTSGSVNNTVWQSNISNNFIGIAVNSSHPNHINNNSILGNVFYAISAPSMPLFYLDAEYNYFGTDNSNQIAKLVTDHVDYTPWLPYRESNVTYIDNYTEWTTNQSLLGGIIVNETGCLNITGTQQNEVTVTFNSTHIQNFIQVNNATNLNNTVLQTGSGPYTLLFLDSSNGRIENSNFSNFMGIGIQSGEQRLSSDQGIYIVNDSFFQSAYGMVLHRANYTLIEESTVISNEHFGLLLHSSKQVDMGPNNSVSYNRRGLVVEDSTQTNISGNEFRGNVVSGISFEEFWPSTWSILDRYSEYNDVTDNTFLANGIGTLLGNASRHNNVTDNNFTANTEGVYITGWFTDGDHRIALNEFYDNGLGVEIERPLDNDISENSFVANSVGIYLEDSKPQFYPFSGITNRIADNSILNANIGERGIYLVSSEVNFIYNNTVNSTLGGVKDTDTWGIYLELSDSNILSENKVDSNEHGIRLESSPDNNLTFNSMTNNFYNFGVTGSEIDHFPQEINTSNQVNGTKIYYWVEATGGEIPSNAGYVGLISCTNVTVPNATIHNNYQGILLVNTTNSTIRNVTVNWTYHGAYLYLSSNATIEGYGAYRSLFDNNTVGVRMHLIDQSEVTYTDFTNNTDAGIYITGTSSQYATWNNISRVYAGYTPWNGYGIRIEYAKNMIISNSTIDHCGNGIYIDGGWPYPPGIMSITVIFNNISNNIQNGVRLLRAKYNLLVNNSFYQNEIGIYVWYISYNNRIYHNNFQENTGNYTVDANSKNYWDNDYPLPDGGGNWWCGFPCNDTKSGKNTGSGQPDDDPDGDGICDQAHVITYDKNIDYHPLRYPADVGPR